MGRYYMDTSKRSRSMRMSMQHRGYGRRGKKQERGALIDISLTIVIRIILEQYFDSRKNKIWNTFNLYDRYLQYLIKTI